MKYLKRIARAAFSFLAGLILAPLFFGSPIARADVAVPCDLPTDPSNLIDGITTEVPQTEQSTPDQSAAPVQTDAPPTSPDTNDPPHFPKIRFSELLPDPIGDDEQEFIELRNEDGAEAGLAGWKISDTKGHVFVINDLRVGAGGFLTLLYAESKIRLTNDGGTYSLTSPDGVVADLVRYASPVPEGRSYSFIDGAWQWASHPTPGAQNVADTPSLAALATTDSADAIPPSTATTTGTNQTPAAPMQEPSVLAVVGGAVSFSALLPNPSDSGAEEWIELHNASQTVLVLDGWKIVDASGKTFTLSGVNISPEGAVRLPKSVTKIALNNDEEDLRLLDPTGAVRDEVSYANAPAGGVFADVAGVWHWSTIPAAATLALVSADATEAVDAVDTSPEPTIEPPQEIRIENIDDLDAGTLIAVTGVVTLPPGVIGKTTFAVSDPDGGAGAYVRIRGGGAFSAMAKGDVIRIVGKTADDPAFSIVSAWRDLKVTGKGRLSAISDRFPSELGWEDAGLEVRLKGLVSARGKRWLSIADASAEREVRVSFMHGEAPQARAGDEATVAGVVRFKNGSPELIVLDRKAASIIKAAEEGEVAVAEPPEAELTKTKFDEEPLFLDSHAERPLGTYVALGMTLAGGAAYFLWKRFRFA